MKANDYRKMTEDELQKELDGLRKNLFQIRTKKITDVVEKSSVIRQTRRDVARVLTVLRERKAKPGAAGQAAAPAPSKESAKGK
jgi:large subunit ribosomal protein L29